MGQVERSRVPSISHLRPRMSSNVITSPSSPSFVASSSIIASELTHERSIVTFFQGLACKDGWQVQDVDGKMRRKEVRKWKEEKKKKKAWKESDGRPFLMFYLELSLNKRAQMVGDKVA